MAYSKELTNIRRSDVPEYLRRSELYLSFSDAEDDEEISVPADCFKLNPIVSNASQLEYMLQTMRFWIVKDIPEELVNFLLSPLFQNARHVLAKFEHTMEFPWLHILHKIRPVRRKEATNICAEHGSVMLLDYFVKSGVAVKMLSLRIAAENGHTECLDYIHKELVRKGKLFPFDDRDCLPLIAKGNVECVKYIVEHGHTITDDMCVHAASFAQTKCLQYLLDKSNITYVVISYYAAKAGSLACLQCAVEHNCPAGAEVWSVAVACIDCLQYLLHTFPEHILTDDLLLQACQTASVASFFLLQEHGCPYHQDMVDGAAKSGSMEILWLLDDLGFDCWIPTTMAAAAGAGQLELIQALNEMGSEWDDSAPTLALMEGQASCLEYLIRQRAVPTSEAFEWILGQTTSVECYRVVKDRRAELAVEKDNQDGVSGESGESGGAAGGGESGVGGVGGAGVEGEGEMGDEEDEEGEEGVDDEGQNQDLDEGDGGEEIGVEM